MNKNIIIAILIVIIIATTSAAVMFGQTANGKMTTKINITCDDEVQNGEQVQFELKDSKGSPILGQDLNITFNNQNYTIPTDQNGKCYLTISSMDAGTYSISAVYAGNDKYDGCNAKTNITIVDGEADNPATETTGNSSANTSSNDNGSQEFNNTSDNPFPGEPGTHYLGQYELWIRDSDNVIIDAGNDAGVKGIGMTFDEWYAKYGPGSPDYN